MSQESHQHEHQGHQRCHHAPEPPVVRRAIQGNGICMAATPEQGHQTCNAWHGMSTPAAFSCKAACKDGVHLTEDVQEKVRHQGLGLDEGEEKHRDGNVLIGV